MIDTNDLKELGKKMNAQNTRMTQFPLFVVQELKEVVKADGCGDRTIYVCDEDELSYEEYNEILDMQSEEDETVKKEFIEKSERFDSVEELNAFDSYAWRAVDISDEWVISDMAGTFLTAEACETHIAQNSYHYRQPRSYAISAWRNYEMQEVMEYLSALGSENGKPLSQYRT